MAVRKKDSLVVFYILVADVSRVDKLHLTNATVLAIGSINGDTALKFLVGVIT